MKGPPSSHYLVTMITFFFLLTLIASSKGEHVFYRRVGKRLDAPHMHTVENVRVEECMSICMYQDHCRAFNLFESIRKCVFLDNDRCAVTTSLVDGRKSFYFSLVNDTSSTYFDTIIKCPKGKSII